MAAPLVTVGPELTLVRQGEGDLRQTFPTPGPDLGATPALHIGVVERTVRLALGGEGALTLGSVNGAISASAALHRVSNLAHVAGVSDTRFVGSVTAQLRFRLSGVLGS
jgi:hypothetical protein